MASAQADTHAPADGTAAPGLGEAASQLQQAGKDSLASVNDMRRALSRLVSADIALARIALVRAAVWIGVAVAFGASAWLLLMAALITGLHALGLSWLAATGISAAVSLVITGIAAWRALHFFGMGRFEATRRQLARLAPGDRSKDEDDEDDAPLDMGVVQRRIARADQLLTGRSAQLKANLAQVQGTWKASWTPLRILGAGLGLGFVSGKLKPEKAATGLAAQLGAAPKVLQTLTALTGLLAASKAKETADEAVDKAEAAQAATPELARAAAAAAGIQRPVTPVEPRQPPPAEAATELGDDSHRS